MQGRLLYAIYEFTISMIVILILIIEQRVNEHNYKLPHGPEH